MIRALKNEKWKILEFEDDISEDEHFKISTYGRIINCKTDQEFLVKKSFIHGYQILRVRKKNGKQSSKYVHKLLAQNFLEQGDGEFVIHLNYDKKDNHIDNLKWATRREKEVHQFTNPEYVNKEHKRCYSKLTEGRVKLIKRKIHDPNRRTRMKMIAKQFGISEMQLYRIKTGENWGSVTEY